MLNVEWGQRIQHSTFNIQHSRMLNGVSAFNIQHSTFNIPVPPTRFPSPPPPCPSRRYGGPHAKETESDPGPVDAAQRRPHSLRGAVRLAGARLVQERERCAA